MNALICRKKKSITVHKIITLSINILRAEDVVICMHTLVIEKKNSHKFLGWLTIIA